MKGEVLHHLLLNGTSQSLAVAERSSGDQKSFYRVICLSVHVEPHDNGVNMNQLILLFSDVGFRDYLLNYFVFQLSHSPGGGRLG